MYTRIDNMHKLTYEEAKEIFAKALFQSPETHPIYKEAVEKIDDRIEKNGYEIVMKADDDDLQFSGTEYRAYAVVEDAEGNRTEIYSAVTRDAVVG